MRVGDGTVTFRRGEIAESEHRFSWALHDGTGVDGPGGRAIFPRSAAKPFQALPSIEAGVIDRFGLDERHLAVGCSSHGGTERHIAVVREILAAAGLSEDDLACGPLAPRDPAAAAALVAHGTEPGRIHHNCSGKHALGLARCVAEDWPTRGYLAAGHPLQRAMRRGVAAAANVHDDLPKAVDGCGMCTFVVPLGALAGAFGRLAGGGLGPAGQRVAAAMGSNPTLVAYDGAVDTELMAAYPGVVAKIGAEGVIGIGLPDGRGLAVKVHDGAIRALDSAAVATARTLLGLTATTQALQALARPPVLSSRGDVVGDAVVTLR